MVETVLLRATGEVATLRRWVAKANAGARRYRDFAGWTEADIQRCAEDMARVYAADFRVFAPVAP